MQVHAPFRFVAGLALACSLTGTLGAQAMAEDHSHAEAVAGSLAPAAAPNPALPPDAEGAKAALERTPRHTEWFDVALPGSETKLRTFVVFPERKDKAPVAIVIHEIFGLSDWVRSVADQLAREGFIAVAPDLISGLGPNGGGTESLPSRDDVVRTIRGLSADDAAARLDAVRSWATALPAANGKAATIGFCWGGGRSFAYASRPGLDAAVVYYGGAPEGPALAATRAPVLGLYGGDDARINATIDGAKAELGKLGRTYEVEIYPGAGHGFLRQQAERDGANRRATEQAWPRTLAFLKRHTGETR